MNDNRQAKPLGHTIWFKIILTAIMFLPSFTQLPYDSAKTSEVISAVMSHPLAVAFPILLPAAKLLLLVAALFAYFYNRHGIKALLIYYSAMLFISGTFENTAFTSKYGFVWLLGNTVLQFTAAVYCIVCIAKGRSQTDKCEVIKKRVWVIIPMLLAFLMPYAMNAQKVVVPVLNISVFTNEAAVTYCMITPVIFGLLIMFSKSVYKPLLSVLSYVGLLYGIMNMITWFVLQNQNWWMGVLHIPLLVLSFYGLILAHQEKQLV